MLLLSACDGIQSTLQPNGPDARAIATLYWVLLALATLVSVAVVAALLYALFRRRDFTGVEPPLRLAPRAARLEEQRLRGEPTQKSQGETPELTASDDEPLDVLLYTAEQDRRSLRWIVIAGVVIPLVILTGSYLYTLHTIGQTHAERDADLTIEVVGHQWWWEVHYVDAAGERWFETANEVHIPAGQRVRFRLRSSDVIHSFWVPQLGGKLDMIPGRTNQFTLQADEPGVYRGQCAEYCAGPHALMAFLVIAQPEEEFRRWAEEQARPAPPVGDPLARAGWEVFSGQACVACHAIRGTPADGDLGPDLTHLASRRTLAAATVPNNRGHLGGWIQNPHRIKPDVHMPAVPMDSEEFLALLHYLQSLR
jgi:cytochrome c oxidase subunit 2